jgi:hypothetical protein
MNRNRKRSLLLAGLAASVALAGVSVIAQVAPSPTPAPEAPAVKPDQQTATGLKAAPAPGTEAAQPPDSFLEFYYEPWTIPKAGAIPKGENLIQPSGFMPNYLLRVIGEDGDNYIVQNLPIEDPRSYMHKQWKLRSREEAARRAVDELRGEEYMVSGLEAVVPSFVDALDFSVSRDGLPQGGLWQVSFDVADVNGDGKPDLVLPPQRKGDGTPTILLGDGKGGFSHWTSCRWPADVELDYGGVKVGDFDGDGHADIAVACHFRDSYILYGDGKGDFSRNQKLPMQVLGMTAKAVTVADFNRDGKTDVALLAELDFDRQHNQRFVGPMVNLLLNQGGEWQPSNAGMPQRVFGDHVAVGDVDGDGYPDLVVASHSGGNRQIVLLNPGKKGREWRAVGELQMPFAAFVYGVAVGNVCNKKGAADVVTCFEQPKVGDPGNPAQACVLYHFHDSKGKFVEKPRPEVLLKDNILQYILSVDIGDVDGDGRPDIVASRSNGDIVVLLQRQPGRFYRQHLPTQQLPVMMAYDVKVRDVNGDGRGEIIVMGPGEAGGGVYVLTGKPKAPAVAARAR